MSVLETKTRYMEPLVKNLGLDPESSILTDSIQIAVPDSSDMGITTIDDDDYWD